MSAPDDEPASPPSNAPIPDWLRLHTPFAADLIASGVPADHPLADPAVFQACMCGWLASLHPVRHDAAGTPLEQRVRAFTQAIEAAMSGNASDSGDSDMPDLEEVEDSSPDEDSWREPYLQYILAVRDCPRRRVAAGLPAIACSRGSPCYDCSAHPGAAATSVHWQTMSELRVAQELAFYLRGRSNLAPWVPPSPNTRARMHIPPIPAYGIYNVPSRASTGPNMPPRGHWSYRRRRSGSNQASPASSIRSEPPSSMNALPSTSEQAAPNVAFGPPRSPPAYEDLSDLSD